MVYFDIRPSVRVPTLELRVTDSCPDVDTVILIAGLFRALVRRGRDDVLAGVPAIRRPAPLLRAAMWRAARSGLEGELLDLPRSPRPVPAATAVRSLLDEIRPYLAAIGDWDEASTLAEGALARGSSAAEQRRAYQRRGRLADVVDLLLERTRAGGTPPVAVGTAAAASTPYPLRQAYAAAGDEVLRSAGPVAAYDEVLTVLDRLGAGTLRHREIVRDEEQRSHGVTLGVPGEASTRLFPVDLLPRIVSAVDWSALRAGVQQRARALDAFLHDVYADRAVVADGVVPAWVIEGAPGLRPSGVLMHRQTVRAHVCGMDLVRDGSGRWFVLEDNVRVPSGLGYAVQNSRLTSAVMPDLPRPGGLLDVEAAPGMLRDALVASAPPAAADSPRVVLLSEGATGPAWFEHKMLGEEMGVSVAASNDLLVEDDRVFLVRQGARLRVDVVYLRIDEDALVHASGADGRPLGARVLRAVDAGAVTLANAPGNGVGDDKAIYSFVPRLVEYYLGEQPLLAEVVLHQPRHERVDRLVVADPVAGRVRQCDRAGIHRAQHPRPQRSAVRPRGVHEGVLVNAQVHHVDPEPRALADQEDPVVLDQQVIAGGDGDPHLLAQHLVLEPRRPGRSLTEQDDARGVSRDRRCAGHQRIAQHAGRRLDVEQAAGARQIGHHGAGQPAVLDRVAEAGGHPDVVLQHEPPTRPVAHEVHAADVGADCLPVHQHAAGPQSRCSLDDPRRHDAVGHHLPVGVDIVQERVQGTGPLLHACPQGRPVDGRNDPGQQVDREQPGAGLTGNAERHAVRALLLVAHDLAVAQRAGAEAVQNGEHLVVRRHRPGRAEDLVASRGIGLPQRVRRRSGRRGAHRDRRRSACLLYTSDA